LFVFFMFHPFEREGTHRGFDRWGLCPRARRVPGRSLPRPKKEGLVRLHAALGGALRVAFERAAQARGPRAPRSRAGAASISIERTSREQDNQPAEPPRLRRHQKRQAELLAGDRRRLAACRRRGFNLKLDYLPLNGADIVIRKPKAEADEADTAAVQTA
jgi:hypothetical protein